MTKMSRRTVIGGAIGLPIAAIAMTGVLANQAEESTPTASPQASPSATPAAIGSITVEAQDISYSVTEIKGPADTDVAITLVNKGVLEHDLVIDDLELATELLRPGQEDTIVVNAPAGTYEYYCTVAGHKQLGMVGTLTLV